MPTLEEIKEIKQQAYKSRGGKSSRVVQGKILQKSGFSWKYEHGGTAWDAEAGVSASSGKKKSKDDAREHSLANLATGLYNHGLFKKSLYIV